MTVLRFTVPWPVVGVNAQYERDVRTTPDGRVFLGVHKSQAATLFHGAVANYGLLARRLARFATMPRPTQADVIIWFYFQNERHDGDGPVKSVLDAMQVPNLRLNVPGASIYENDAQVRDHLVRKRIDAVHPRVEIAVGPAGEVFAVRELGDP